MILGRIEALLEAHQPEEHHGFRKHRRMDEHLVTATLFLDKAWDKGIPVWIVSDLSKAFDRANWNALWLAFRDHGVSDHLIWILQLIYSSQSGEVEGEHSNNNPFPIHAGVRQGCVLSPRLFRSVLQWGMSVWRQNAETQKCGFDFGDNMSFLLDLPFADDILLFARTAAEAMALLDDLVHKLQNIGLQLNTGKPVVFSSEVQPPSFLHTHNGGKLRVLQQQEAHKWIGCMISAAGSRNRHLDLQHHLQAASRAFHANKWILCDKGVSVLHRLRYFETVISPVAYFGASHPAIHKNDLAKLDVEYRRLMRMIVGPPADTNLASHWHEILYGWNNKAQVLSEYAGLTPWFVTRVEAVWKFASCVATLPSERWTRRILDWNIEAEDHGNEEDLLTLGRPRCKDIPSAKAVAIGLWRLPRMIIRCSRYRILCFSRCTLVDRVKSRISFACALKGLPSCRQVLTLTLTLILTLPNQNKTNKLCAQRPQR